MIDKATLTTLVIIIPIDKIIKDIITNKEKITINHIMIQFLMIKKVLSKLKMKSINFKQKKTQVIRLINIIKIPNS